MAVRPILIALTAFGLSAPAPPPARLTIVELFTSQGCSSCPPANANLAALADARADVVPLSFGVTYWDRLGWKDVFAQPAFTQRQWAYAAAFGRRTVATPEMVVNGRADVVGNRRGEIDALIARLGPVAGPTIGIDGGAVIVGKGPAGTGPADVWLARYDPRTVQVPVRAGENGGRTLPHRNVVHALVRLGAWTGSPQRYALPPAERGLSGVVFVQGAKAGPIVAAARAS